MLKAALTVLFAALASTAYAQLLSQPSMQDAYQARLLRGWPQSDQSHVAGIQIALAPGWKTYWRVPGAGGIAPRFNWSRSRNLKSVAYLWPSPHVFTAYGMQTLGFEHQLVLPLVLQPIDPAKPVEAHVEMHFGICADICVPAEAALAAVIFEPDRANAPMINAMLTRRPASAAQAGLVAARCVITPKGDDEFLLVTELEFNQPRGAQDVLVIETGTEDIWVSEPDTRVQGRRVTAEADLVNYGDGPLALSRQNLRFTLISGGGNAVDIQGCTAG